jgi:hypothetical protein
LILFRPMSAKIIRSRRPVWAYPRACVVPISMGGRITGTMF